MNYNRSGFLTEHAKQRSAEREISEEIALLVMKHGESYAAPWGRIVFWFNRESSDRCRLPWSAKKDAYNVAVVQACDGAVVTVMHCFVKQNEWESIISTYRCA